MRRILVIVAAVIVVIGIVVALVFVFASSSPSSEREPDSFFQIATDIVGGLGGNGGTGTTEQEVGALTPRLSRIAAGPVAPGVIVLIGSTTPTTETASSTDTTAADGPVLEVRYVERATGNVYRYDHTTRASTRISNQIIPGIQQATWLPDGSTVFLRYISGEDIEQIATYGLPLTSVGGGLLLEPNLAQLLVIGPRTILTLLTNSSSAIGTLSAPDGSGAETVFTLPLTEVRVSSLSGGYLVTTRPSALSDGYAFELAGGDALLRVLGPLRGLTTLPSPSGEQVLFSSIARGVPGLSLLSLSTREITTLPLATLSEKCAWAGETTVYCAVPKTLSGSLPDEWYQGVTNFSDRLWKIDLTDRLATLVVDPEEAAEVSVDAISLTVDAGETAMVFTDKTTGALYLYSL